MPKLTNKNPVLGHKESRAVVRYRGKTHYLKKPDGTSCKPGTKEALAAYNRLCLELQNNPSYVAPRAYAVASGESDVTIDELLAGYLTYAKARLLSDYSNWLHFDIQRRSQRKDLAYFYHYYAQNILPPRRYNRRL